MSFFTFQFFQFAMFQKYMFGLNNIIEEYDVLDIKDLSLGS